MDIPFNVYGGLDRNGLWAGPASGWADGGARDREWMELGPDDGFGILVDPDEAGRGYAVARNGELIRFNRQTGERKRIRPWAPDFAALRVNQNAPIALDPHDTQGIYYGSQFVHKSVDQGETWQIISGDLTANDPAGRREEQSNAADRNSPATGAGGFTTDTNGSATNAEPVEGAEEAGGATITVIAPSAIDRDVIWVGTDEGDVQVTRSAGGEWESVRDRIDRVPDSSWVAHIEPSVFRPGSAYVAFDAQRTGNRDPLIFWTDNYGRDWSRIAAESDIEGVVHTLEQDPVVEALLFAGTEAGLYVSLNRGEDWTKWTHGLPPVPVHDLVLHPRDHDLVIATYGRAAYVLDDIRPLRELARNPGAVDLELLLFEPPPAFIRGTPMSERDNGSGHDSPPSECPPLVPQLCVAYPPRFLRLSPLLSAREQGSACYTSACSPPKRQPRYQGVRRGWRSSDVKERRWSGSTAWALICPCCFGGRSTWGFARRTSH